MSFTKQEWNNGTIYRIFVQRSLDAETNIIDVPVDIAQSELTGKVFIGVENFCLDRRLAPLPSGGAADYDPSNLGAQRPSLINNWSFAQYLQLGSINLQPDIDYTTDEASNIGRNTTVFARFPLETRYTEKETLQTGSTPPLPTTQDRHPMIPRVTGTFSLNKDGILYEMTNNPHALSNGRLRIQLIDDDSDPWDLTAFPIHNLMFTLVIYKPRNTYN